MNSIFQHLFQNYISNHHRTENQGNDHGLIGTKPVDWLTNAAVFAGADALLNRYDEEHEKNNIHFWRNAGIAGALALGYQYWKNHHDQQQQQHLTSEQAQPAQALTYFYPQQQQQQQQQTVEPMMMMPYLMPTPPAVLPPVAPLTSATMSLPYYLPAQQPFYPAFGETYLPFQQNMWQLQQQQQQPFYPPHPIMSLGYPSPFGGMSTPAYPQGFPPFHALPPPPPQIPYMKGPAFLSGYPSYPMF